MLDYFRSLRSHFKRKLQGLELTEMDIHHLNFIKYYLADLETEVKTRDEELKEISEILGDSDEKSVRPGYMSSARTNAQCYLNAFSLFIHKIEKGNTSFSQLSFHFSSDDNNPSLLEYLMVTNFECLRRFALDIAVPKLFDIHKRFQERISCGAKLVKHFYKEYPAVFGSFDQLNFRLSSLIEPNLKRYIKTKIDLEPKIILKDDDLREFFEEKCDFKYPQVSPLWVSYLDVSLFYYLTIDVSSLD
jgi:hypothetical protein